jgi:rare lipoprotein A
MLKKLEKPKKLLKLFHLIMFVLVSSCCFLKLGAISTAHAQNRSTTKTKSTYHVYGRRYQVMNSGKNYSAKGVASWYGPGFHMRRTSSGERYNMYQMTAAHKTLPLFTYVQVTNLVNGRKVIVKINDRGPFVRNRIIDLSYAAARKLAMVGRGTAKVSIKTVSYV